MSANAFDEIDLKSALKRSIEKLQSDPIVEIEQTFDLANKHFLLEIKSVSVEAKGSQYTFKTSGKCLDTLDRYFQIRKRIQDVGATLNEMKIRWSAAEPSDVVSHALKEHENLLHTVISCFSLDPRLSGFNPSIIYEGSEVVISGIHFSINPAFVLCSLQSAVADSKQLRDKSDPVPSQSSLPFTEPRSVRAFHSILNEQELLLLQETCFAEYVFHVKEWMASMLKNFYENVLPILLKQELTLRGSIEQNFAEMIALESQLKDLGLEIQAKVLRELGIPKILKAKLSVEQLMNTLRI